MSADPFLEGLLKEAPRLHRYALSLTHRTVDAEDLSQETLCRAIARRDRFKADTNLGGWLHVIARNLFIDTRRRPPVLELKPTFVSHVNIEDQAIAYLQLTQVLVGLDPALAMRAIGMGSREIGHRLHLSPKSVNERISRSRRRARAMAA